MAHGAITAGTADSQRSNTNLVPVNPAHVSGDTLLCIVFAADGSVTESCSTAGWTAADGITNPITIGSVGKLYFFQNECDSASESNPTIIPSGSSNTLNVHIAVVLRLQSRDFAGNFSVGTLSDNAAGTSSIAFAQNSPSVDVGNAIIAISGIFNDYTTAPGNLSGQAAGLSWSEILDFTTTTGNDGSLAIDYAINNGGSAYTAGTGATKSGGSWTSSKTFGLYIESVGSSGQVYNDTLSESAASGDSLAAAAAVVATLSESAAAGESQAAATTFVTALAEISAGAESVTGGLLFTVTVSEAATGAETVAATPSFNLMLAESATGADSVAAVGTFTAVRAESAAGTDSVAAAVNFTAARAETATAADSLTGGILHSASLAESATGAAAMALAVTFNAARAESAAGAAGFTSTLIALSYAQALNIRAIRWIFDCPAAVNLSGWTGAATVITEPWRAKWRAEVELAPVIGEANVRRLRSFLAQRKGRIVPFRLNATETAQNANSGVTVASTAAQGATAITLAGAATALKEGQFLTVNGQLLCCTADQSGSTVNFKPPLRETASAGTVVVTSRPYALVTMAASRMGWSTAPGRVFGIGFAAEEAVLESDPEPVTE